MFQSLCLEHEISVLLEDFLRKEGPVAKEDEGNTTVLISLLQDLPETLISYLVLGTSPSLCTQSSERERVCGHRVLEGKVGDWFLGAGSLSSAIIIPSDL